MITAVDILAAIRYRLESGDDIMVNPDSIPEYYDIQYISPAYTNHYGHDRIFLIVNDIRFEIDVTEVSNV